MIEFIKGHLHEKTPTYAIIESYGIGYYVNISMCTFSSLTDSDQCLLLIHEVIREDAHTLFGFTDEKERTFFRLLISVDGVGPTTARLILSYYSVEKIKSAIAENNIQLLQGIKGIGKKTAEKLIFYLADKLQKSESNYSDISPEGDTYNQSLSALMNLGFSKSSIKGVLEQTPITPHSTLEETISFALKRL